MIRGGITLSDLLFLQHFSDDLDNVAFIRRLVGFLAKRRYKVLYYNPAEIEKQLRYFDESGDSILKNPLSQASISPVVKWFNETLQKYASLLQPRIQPERPPALEKGVAELIRIKGDYRKALATPLEELYFLVKGNNTEDSEK